MSSYRKETKIIRQQRDEESRIERDAVKEILGVWKSLRDVRKQQGFHNTDLKLVIHKEAANMREDESNWRDEIDRELQEAEQYFEETADDRNKDYEERLEAWKGVHSKILFYQWPCIDL